MANNEIFSTVMRGYKKEEVAAYIASMSEQIQMLQNERDKSAAELHRLKAEIEELSNASSTDESVNEELRTQIKEELEAQLREEYDAKLLQQKNELQTQLTSAQNNAELERKAKEYDECKDTLAELMIQARRNADEILSEAEAKAQMLRSKAEVEYSQLGANFALLQQRVNMIREELTSDVAEITDQFNVFDQKLSEIQSEVSKTMECAPSEQEIPCE